MHVKMWMCSLCRTHQRACSSHQETLPSYEPHLPPVTERSIHVIVRKIFFVKWFHKPWLSNSVIKQGEESERSHIKGEGQILVIVVKVTNKWVGWYIVCRESQRYYFSFPVLRLDMGSGRRHLICATTYYRVCCIVLGLPGWADFVVCGCVRVCVCADLEAHLCDLSHLFIWKVCMFNSVCVRVCT